MTETLKPAEAKPQLMSLDVVIPVYNEDCDLERSVRALRSYLDDNFPFRTTITIADNASTDGTWEVARRLEADLEGVRALHLSEKGRGRALRAAWTTSEADIVAYMDVDLSTDLDALLPLVAPIASGHSDIAIGTRLAHGAQVIRGPKREVISRIYNLLLRLVLHNRFTDAQCGFKAIRAKDARALLPAVEDNEWFFDTEMLVLAERNGLRIHEVPVDWADDPDSRVRIAHTAIADLSGVLRLIRTFASGGGQVAELEARRDTGGTGEYARYVGVGVLSTIVYLTLYLLLRTQMNGYIANIASLTLCSVGNFAVHWRYTFRRGGPTFFWAAAAVATLPLCISAVVTTWSLALSGRLDPGSLVAQVLALLGGTAFAAFGRFLVFRALVFRTHLRDRGSSQTWRVGKGGPSAKAGSSSLRGPGDGWPG
jgi:glycosyltransferase involved in cell wall biosynthesis